MEKSRPGFLEFEEDDCFLWRGLLGAGRFQKRLVGIFHGCWLPGVPPYDARSASGTGDCPELQAGHTDSKISTWALFRAKQTENMKNTGNFVYVRT